MADLLSILSQASTSLSAQRSSAATASHNLSNANTPGFARQRAELEATLPAEQVAGAFIGRGANLLTVSQARDRFLEAQIPGTKSQASSSTAHSDALQSVSALDPDGGAGLSSALGDFYGALRTLSQNPSDSGMRQAAVSSARVLAMAFNRTGESLEAARTGIDAKLAGSLGETNQLASTVASLNREIRIARASGAEPNDLLDARLRASNRLATLTGARPVPDAAGNISLVLANGTALVSGDRAASLSAQPDPANGGHLTLSLTRADGSGPQPVTTAEFGGETRGLLDARDLTLAKSVQSLDTLAFDLGGALNAVHRTGFALDGSTGRDLFVTGATSQGAALHLAVDPTIQANPLLLGAAGSAATVPGDSSALLSLIGTERQALSAGLDPGGALSQIISDFGASASRMKAAAEHDSSLLDHVESMRESVSGVSIDEEMINMTRAQRGFEAVMKVLKTTDEMLETLLSLK